MCFENSSILVFSFQITLLSDLFVDKLKIVGSIDNTKFFFFLSFFPFLPWAHHSVLLSCFLISFSLTFPIDNREWWSSNKTLNNTVVGKFIAFASAFFFKNGFGLSWQILQIKFLRVIFIPSVCPISLRVHNTYYYKPII